MFETLNFQR